MGASAVIEIPLLFALLSLLAVPVAWLVPRNWALDAVAAWTAIVLYLLSPISAIWLVTATVLTPLWFRLADGSAYRNLATAIWVAVLLAPFFVMRWEPNLPTIGGAFFTLRLLHVTGDWWMHRGPVVSLRDHLRYQLFLPVILSGPIHRMDRFTRECQRRRFSSQDMLSGLERVLIGATLAWPAVFIWRRVIEASGQLDAQIPPFLFVWLQSALDWVTLYLSFAGLSSVAIGTGLLMGVRLEENFNRPWASVSLLDFWTRWHMTLSSWVTDYVFRPVSAITRSPLIGLCAAMLAIGLWHEFSAYYLLWSIWQVLGIVLSRRTKVQDEPGDAPNWVAKVLGPVVVLGWLSAARPVIQLVIGVF